MIKPTNAGMAGLRILCLENNRIESGDKVSKKIRFP